MVRRDLNEKLSQAMPDLTKKQVKGMVDMVFDEIKKALKSGEAVLITGFGKFYTKKVGPKVQRVPGTSRTVNVPAKRVARFKAGKALKEAVK